MAHYHGDLTTLPTTTSDSRSLVTAYVLWFFVGITGAHRHYMGSKTGGWAQTGLFLVSILWLSISPWTGILGLLLLGALCIWVLLDAFFIPFML